MASSVISVSAAPAGAAGLVRRLAEGSSKLLWYAAGLTGLLGAVALALTAVTGEKAVAEAYLQWHVPAAVSGFTLAAYLLALAAWRVFEPGEPLRRPWFLLMTATGIRLAAILAALLGAVLDTVGLVSRTMRAAGGDGLDAALYNPLAMCLLAVGLFLVLGVHARAGLIVRPAIPAGAAVALGAVLLLGAVSAVGRGAISWAAAVSVLFGRSGMPVLFAVLLIEAAALFRASEALRGGLISRCWTVLAVAVFLAALDAGWTWAAPAEGASWTARYLHASVQLLASLSFALAPALQVEAIARARGSSSHAA